MRVHIWIRKENEDWWEKNGSSAWVNVKITEEISGVARVDEYFVAGERNARVEKDKPESVVDLCKHGMAKGNCKYGC